MGTIDEGHDDVADAGLHLHGNLREALHDQGASRGRLAIGKRLILRSADRLAEHDLAVNHDDQGALVLYRTGIQAHPQIVHGDAILAVSREIVLEPDAAARAQRQRDVRVLIGRDGVLHVRNLRSATDREFRHLPGSGDVLIQERGGHAQSGRNVVEAVHLDVLGQDLLHFHVHTHQSLDLRGVLGAVHPLDRNITRVRTFGMGVQGILHPGDERIDILLRWLKSAGRRHQTSAQLAQGLLPDLRIIRRGLEIEAVQRDATGLHARVVAADAVSVQHRAMLIRSACRRSLPHSPVLQNRQRGDQNHQSTRKNETLHILQPIALSAICSRMNIICFITKASMLTGGGKAAYLCNSWAGGSGGFGAAGGGPPLPPRPNCPGGGGGGI